MSNNRYRCKHRMIINLTELPLNEPLTKICRWGLQKIRTQKRERERERERERKKEKSEKRTDSSAATNACNATFCRALLPSDKMDVNYISTSTFFKLRSKISSPRKILLYMPHTLCVLHISSKIFLGEQVLEHSLRIHRSLFKEIINRYLVRVLALTTSQLIRWQESNPANNSAGNKYRVPQALISAYGTAA